MVANNPANEYLRTKILTANPQELRMMLYEGAIKYCHLALAAFESKEIEPGYNALMRAQKIVLELSSSLNHQVAPELCEKLSALYTYIYRLLVDANIQRQTKPLQEALELLAFEKNTWQQLMNKSATEAASTSQAHPQHVQNTQQTAISSLSVDG